MKIYYPHTMRKIVFYYFTVETYITMTKEVGEILRDSDVNLSKENKVRDS